MHALQVKFDSTASAMKGVLRELGAAAVTATGVTVAGEKVNDNCLTVAAAASKAIMYASVPACMQLMQQIMPFMICSLSHLLLN